MKIIYKNVSQVIKTLEWQKVTKSTNNCRSVEFGSCSDLQSVTKLVAKVKILTNTTAITSGAVYVGCGDQTPIDHISAFYGGSGESLDLTVNAVKSIERTISVTATQISNNQYIKLGIKGASSSENNQISQGITFEVEYYFV